MVIRPLAPNELAAPAAAYAHAIEVQQATTFVHTSGIVPTAPDGTVAATIGEQAEEIWRTIGALLTDAGLGPSDVVSVTTYVIPGQELATVMAARDAFLGGHLAASTLVVVAALVKPEWRLEISVVAAR